MAESARQTGGKKTSIETHTWVSIDQPKLIFGIIGIVFFNHILKYMKAIKSFNFIQMYTNKHALMRKRRHRTKSIVNNVVDKHLLI